MEKFHIPQENPLDSGREKESRIELSAEQIEKIMEKVTDIYEYGTAYKSLPEEPTAGIRANDDQHIEYILKKGLLGYAETEKTQSLSLQDRIPPDLFKDNWTSNVRRERRADVNFNIVGRTLAIGRIKSNASYIPTGAGKDLRR